jgi:hypothetical protein
VLQKTILVFSNQSAFKANPLVDYARYTREIRLCNRRGQRQSYKGSRLAHRTTSSRLPHHERLVFANHNVCMCLKGNVTMSRCHSSDIKGGRFWETGQPFHFLPLPLPFPFFSTRPLPFLLLTFFFLYPFTSFFSLPFQPSPTNPLLQLKPSPY